MAEMKEERGTAGVGMVGLLGPHQDKRGWGGGFPMPLSGYSDLNACKKRGFDPDTAWSL